MHHVLTAWKNALDYMQIDDEKTNDNNKSNQIVW